MITYSKKRFDDDDDERVVILLLPCGKMHEERKNNQRLSIHRLRQHDGDALFCYSLVLIDSSLLGDKQQFFSRIRNLLSCHSNEKTKCTLIKKTCV